ncbi:paraquat-inducible protein A [Marinobacterium rhizophilum]|uniref:paraquat-inducible protein A n=1 Tax=Marinobacterium rhizophilum TaxID=420402 RepID=UPI002102EC7D|nr:paraquat-inducible protein A [Marinobacterium rhizophilum]
MPTPTRPALTARRAWQLRLLLALTALLLLVGLYAPMLTIEQFLFIQSSFSVMSGTWQLLVQGQYLLFLLIAGFSIVLPALKLLVLLRLTGAAIHHDSRLPRYLKLMHDYGRWSMLDVFVVAVLVVTVKLGAIAQVQVHYGLYAFCAAVLLTLFITACISRLGPDND